MAKAKVVASIVEELKRKPQKKITYISSSCSLLNLALTGNVNHGFEAGTVVTFTGESSTAKSLIAGSILADMAYNPTFDDYDLIYMDSENGFKFEKEAFFGKLGAERIKEPDIKREDPPKSLTVQDMAIGIKKALRSGNKFVYVVDSLDGVSSMEDVAKTDEILSAYEDGRTTSGSYNGSKPKFLSQFFSQIAKPLADMESIIITISQTRDNMGGLGGKTRSGGKALGFYANTEVWLAPPFKNKTISKTVDGKEDDIGHRVTFKVKKNRVSGKPRAVTVSILTNYGIDDIATSLEWLAEYKFIDIKKIEIPNIDCVGTKDKVIKFIEDNDLEPVLKEYLQKCWDERESKLMPDRKPKFGGRNA